jgi:hypothetical protein
MKNIIDKIKNIDINMPDKKKIFWIRNIRVALIVFQILQIVARFRIVPAMITAFMIAAVSAVDIVLVEKMYKNGKYNKKDKTILQAVSVAIIIIIWLG